MAKNIFSLSVLLLVLAGCKNAVGTNPSNIVADTAAWDTLSGVKRLDSGPFHVAIQSRNNNQSGILFVYNRKTHRVDSLELPNVTPDSSYTRLTDVARSLAFDRPAILIDWLGRPDDMYSMLVGYVGDTLKVIYADPNPGGIKELHRKDQWTLTGITFAVDTFSKTKLIYCPITISLRTGEATMMIPDYAEVLFDTQATASIAAWRIRGPGDSVAYTIPAGAIFRIDTVFYSKKIAALSVGDSIILRSRLDDLRSKFEGNDD